MTDAEMIETAAPEATPTTEPTPQVDPAAELETLKAKYERAQKDLSKFRTRAEEVEQAQKAAEEKALAEADATKRAELLQAKVAELEKAQADALAKATVAERRAALTGRVSDVDLALAVADQHVTEDGTLDVDALLKAHPTLNADQKRVDLPGARTTAGGTGTLTPEDFKGKSPEWIQANLHRLKPGA